MEYMPPRGVPLPDHDDELLAAELDFTVLQGKNLTRGWYSEYGSKKEDEDDDSELSDFEERVRQIEAAQKKTVEAKKRTVPATVQTLGTLGSRVAPGTIRAKHAASALATKSTNPKSAYVAPTASARARQPTIASSSVFRKKPTPPPTGNPRFTAAKVASNSTIGYSKGRAVSASAGRPLSSFHSRPIVAKADPAEKTSLADLLGLKTLHIEDDEDADFGLSGMIDVFAGEEEDDVFQLDAVQDI
jgi:hypothetical protein